MPRTEKYVDRLDLAARAAWLYYIAGNNQDEIAKTLGVSRQSAQRLVSLAVSERLIAFRLDYPIDHCMKLASKLRSLFDLQTCHIVPSNPREKNFTEGVAIAGANEILKYLESETPKVVALGNGKLLRSCVKHLPPMNCPQHHLVALVGNIRPDGSATVVGVVETLADKIGSKHSPLPIPVLVRNATDLKTLQNLEPIAKTIEICTKSDVTFVGISHFDNASPLIRDGFISAEESRELVGNGAVGEIMGRIFDVNGKMVSGSVDARVSSFKLRPDTTHPVVGLAAGTEKADAILGALRGRLINGLISDEDTAVALISLC